MKIKNLTLLSSLLAVLAFSLVGARAEVEKLTAERLLQQELKQEQLKTTTQRVTVQLGVIIEEYERNGLGGDDVNVLKSIRTVLGRLGDKDMEKVVQLLQLTRTTPDLNASRQSGVEASSKQKFITIQLRQLLLEYQRQQALAALAGRFAALSRRQGDNLKEVVGLSNLLKVRDNGNVSDTHRLSLQLQESEQSTIGDEAKLVLGKLESLTKDMDGPTGERPRAALQRSRDGQLLPTIDSAAVDLKAAKLLSAAGSEKMARDLFQELARMLMPARDKKDILRNAIHEVEKAIAQEKQVVAETKEIEGKNPDTSDIEQRQAEVVDRTENVRHDVENVAPKAAENLKTSTEKCRKPARC